SGQQGLETFFGDVINFTIRKCRFQSLDDWKRKDDIAN
ncbi:MAG: hypothetical protein RLZZ38_1178, partial [Bacteroidota bacterium]